jgi:cation transport regulator ChaC
MSLVFQYGSNMDVARLNGPDRLKGQAIDLGCAETVDQHRVVFNVWSNRNNCAAASIISDATSRVWGVLFDVPERLLDRDTAKPDKSLDAIEGEGSNYTRAQIEVRREDGSIATALTYVALNPQQGIQTSWEYVKHIMKGLSDHHVPGEYVNAMKAWVVENNGDLVSLLQ